ncbi:MAG: c-type cytochrome [Isosphaeraceae bacterium]
MSDPSSSPPIQSLPPLESSEDESSAGRPSLLVALILGLFKLVGVALLVYLTYFFTMSFAHRTTPPAPLTEDQRVLAKKAADLREQEKKLLSSYGWVNPATKSNVRIPIERAMELIVAEAAAPPAPAVVTAAAPGAGRATTTKAPATATPAGTTAPATSPAAVVAVSPPAPAGMPPEEMYRAVCMACHEADGKGKIFRLATPSIPDLTDPKWQDSRSDAELQHSILEGKESIIKGVKSTVMLAQKDNLARAHTDVKDMVAFMRAFKGGKQIVSATPGGTPAVTAPIQIAQNPAPAGPAVSAFPTPPTPASPAQSTAPGSATSMSNAALPSAVTVSTPVVAATPASAPAQASTPAASAAVLPAALPTANTASTAAQAEKIRAAQTTFNTLCIACHGADGRGTAVRAAMPALPNFTSHDWHISKSNNQLTSSIMEGKGLMPAWNTQLTADRARDLALFVRSFGAPELMAETAPASAASTAEFDKEMQALRQKFDDIEKQLQALAAASSRP